MTLLVAAFGAPIFLLGIVGLLRLSALLAAAFGAYLVYVSV